jgi:hypothetical protein
MLYSLAVLWVQLKETEKIKFSKRQRKKKTAKYTGNKFRILKAGRTILCRK